MKLSPHLNDLPSLAIRRPILIVVLNLLIIIAGYAALKGVEVRELPDVDRPIVTVTATFPGAAPETVDTEVTSILEGAAARVSGVKQIRASSEEGSSRIMVEFRPGIDLDNAANEMREAVSQVQRRLPDDVENVAIIKADNNAQAVVSLAISSDTLDLETLTERVRTDLSPQFLSIPGVADVRLNGERRRVMRVILDPLMLASYQITVSEVANVLRQAPFDVPAGSLKSLDQQLIVRADASSVTVDDVENIVIRGTTRVGDVATVFFSPADASGITRLDGKSVIGLGIIRQARSNSIEISDNTIALVERLRVQYPELDIVITSDDAKFIRSSVEEVFTSLALTILLVVGTLWVFIGSWRATIVPSVAIPISLIGALAVIWLFGFSINILTLLALVLATGLIVDDAIVVSENIQRRRGLGLGARASAVVGTREVFFAVVATTAVLAAVFVPIAFLPSTAGRLFREFGVVLASAVVISSFVALSLVPALTARLPVKENTRETWLQRVGIKLRNWYVHTLKVAIDKGVWVVLVSVIIAGYSTYLYFAVDSELMPTEDRGTVNIFARGPDGVGIDFMDRQARQMEEILMPYVHDGSVDSINTMVGQWDPNLVFITVRLTDWDKRTKSQQQIIAEINGPLSQIPGAPGRAFGSNSLNLRGQSGGLSLALTGENYEEIFRAAQKYAARLQAEIPDVGFPRIGYQPTQPQLRVQIDRKRAEELGVPLNDISTTLRASINGLDVVDLNIGDQAVPIMLQAQRDLVRDPTDILNLYVGSNTGLVPLSSLTSITEEGVPAELTRRAQRRAIQIDFQMPTSMPLEEVVMKMRQFAAEELPSGIGLLLLGEAEAFEEASREVTLTYVLALIIVFLVLAAQFESVNSAIVVMTTVPFGVAAAFFALYISGTSINIYSQIGLVMLIGLVAKNSILLVEFADQLRDRGLAIRDAVENAAEIRLRPIMMTLVSTLLGALPLILSMGAGAESRNAIGWVVFGGLLFAVLFTLYLTPVLYLAIARFTKPRADESLRLEREMREAGEI